MAEIVMIINQHKDEHEDCNVIFFAVCNDHFWSSIRVGDEDCVKLAGLRKLYGTNLLTVALHVFDNHLHLLLGTLHVSVNQINLLTGT
jgi:hypothetical protein